MNRSCMGTKGCAGRVSAGAPSEAQVLLPLHIPACPICVNDEHVLGVISLPEGPPPRGPGWTTNCFGEELRMKAVVWGPPLKLPLGGKGTRHAP